MYPVFGNLILSKCQKSGRKRHYEVNTSSLQVQLSHKIAKIFRLEKTGLSRVFLSLSYNILVVNCDNENLKKKMKI